MKNILKIKKKIINYLFDNNAANYICAAQLITGDAFMPPDICDAFLQLFNKDEAFSKF